MFVSTMDETAPFILKKFSGNLLIRTFHRKLQFSEH